MESIISEFVHFYTIIYVHLYLSIYTFKCAGLHLHVDTPVREHHTEEVAEDIHDRDPFFLSGITLEEKTPDVEPFHKFCGKIRNTVSILCGLWYT